MSEDKPTNPEIEAALEPEVAEARGIVRSSDELITLMISMLMTNNISAEAIISYLTVELGIAVERAEMLYKNVYNAGPFSI
ncbi:hypothetical protein GGR95_003670 [Sulfitobacter undariae]|uniref:Uncharacterized protein n=1 Tax=Sulfitobacter undariae TaxID=1563671 RepID=A0A7W6H3M2_9RHOB|nr:hypothetical protein [Sulfitobacter undariae]MBB3996004.1 hypothetical protein [Sulfitobacter undariae]